MLIEGFRIADIGTGTPPSIAITEHSSLLDGRNSFLLPGFIDLHTHGANGVDFTDADEAALQKVSIFFAAHGVTGFLATSWSASPEQIQNLLTLTDSIQGKEQGASILGIHLEGPFINPIRAGAQSVKDIRPATKEEVMPYLDSGLIKIITLAPEIKENQWLIEECINRGITVSAGHTDATYLQMQEAVQKGVRQVTHCFNAMRSFNHREPGIIGAALTMPELMCELIADNVHVHPAAMQLLANARGLENIILITDSIPGAGNPDGSFTLQGRKVKITHNEARLPDGTLAGSMLTMDIALQNMVAASQQTLAKVWQCSSTTAVRAINLSHRKGCIKKGMDADLTLLDSNLQVIMTIVMGEIVYSAN